MKKQVSFQKNANTTDTEQTLTLQIVTINIQNCYRKMQIQICKYHNTNSNNNMQMAQ